MGDYEANIDQQLVGKVKEGNKAAFDLLVKKYQHRIIALINRYIHDQDEALDVAQETFIKAYKAIPRFRGDSAFYTWLYRIAVNTAKNHLLVRKRRTAEVDIDIDNAHFIESAHSLKDFATPENQLYKVELEKVIKQTLDDLPEDLRVALTLREFEGMSYEEIAEIMDCPIGTVRSRIFRAREAIDNEISPFLSN